MNRKSSESARLVLIKSKLEELATASLAESLQRLAEQTVGQPPMSLGQLEDGLKVLLGVAAGEFLFEMTCQLSVAPLEDLVSVCGLDERAQKYVRGFVARWGAQIESSLRGQVLCGWHPVFRIGAYGSPDYELELRRIDGLTFSCQFDRRRAWALCGDILSCLARGGELPPGITPEIIGKFTSKEASPEDR